eukprot:TRINITY_DN1772_c2_g1_i1.p1 TRINITY_DN1772_c2_g1~~TRINITY_DN1772_c2_g1_i1.p1  ORF type:complete len:253 (+),score=62.26 TRINITY_DN1772_c2_g1_i1:98-856(+)
MMGCMICGAYLSYVIQVVRIYFKDGGYKSFSVMPEDTIDDLCTKVAKKMNLLEFQSHFAITEVKGKKEPRAVSREEKPHEIKEQWESEGYNLENGYYKLCFEMKTDSQVNVTRRLSRRFMLKAGESQQGFGLGRTANEDLGVTSSSSSSNDQGQDDDVDALLDRLQSLGDSQTDTVAQIVGGDDAEKIHSMSQRERKGDRFGKKEEEEVVEQEEEQEEMVPLMERDVLFKDGDGVKDLGVVVGRINEMLQSV